jgi:hypothetical protein
MPEKAMKFGTPNHTFPTGEISCGARRMGSCLKSSVVDPDPDPRAWKLIKINKQKIGFSAFFKKAFVHS